jgi:hypothetical protein
MASPLDPDSGQLDVDTRGSIPSVFSGRPIVSRIVSTVAKETRAATMT